MNNREFRNDVQEVWIRSFAKHSAPKPEVKIVTASDMIRLTAMFMCGCLILMGAIIGVVAVMA
jgi:hypothetical protein